MVLRGTFSAECLFFDLFDGAVFIASYVHKEYSLGLPYCHYLLFYM